MTKIEIMAKQLELAQARQKRMQDELELRKAHEKRMAERHAERAAEKARKAANPYVPPTKQHKFLSKEDIDKKVVALKVKSQKLEEQIKDNREMQRGGIASIHLYKTALEQIKREDMPLPDEVESPEAYKRVTAYRASLPSKIAEEEACQVQYDRDFSLLEERVRILDREIRDLNDLRV